MPHGKGAKTSGPSQSTAAAAAAAAAERIPSARAEFSFLASMPATKRSVVQNNKIAVFLASAPSTAAAGPTAIHVLSTQVQVIEVSRGSTLYRINDPSDAFFVIVEGSVTLFDARDKDESTEDDGVVERLGRCECFGDEDLLSASRRAHRAEAGQEASCLLLRVPQELYRKYLAHLHIPDFEDKVEFLGRLEVFRQLPDETLRKLAPCFTQMELRAKEYLVRQGERADSMYAIAAGQCSVLVDPAFKPEMHGLGDTDPKRALQVCLIGPGNIVGDMTVLANVRKRTASILCLAEVVVYKIRRATFVRRVPVMQLEALRQVAEAKLKITENRLAAGGNANTGLAKGPPHAPVLTTLRDKILHGHELRQLSMPQNLIPLDLRGPGPGALKSNVQAMMANGIAAVAAAVGLADTPGGSAGAGEGGGGVVGGGGGVRVLGVAKGAGERERERGGGSRQGRQGTPLGGAVSSLVAGAPGAGLGGGGLGPASPVGSTAAAAALEGARARFSRPTTPTREVLKAQAAAGAGGAAGGGGVVDRRQQGKARRASQGYPPGYAPADVNYSFSLGPSTMLNGLMDRPATAAAPSPNSQPLPRRTQAIDSRATPLHIPSPTFTAQDSPASSSPFIASSSPATYESPPASSLLANPQANTNSPSASPVQLQHPYTRHLFAPGAGSFYTSAMGIAMAPRPGSVAVGSVAANNSVPRAARASSARASSRAATPVGGGGGGSPFAWAVGNGTGSSSNSFIVPRTSSCIIPSTGSGSTHPHNPLYSGSIPVVRTAAGSGEGALTAAPPPAPTASHNTWTSVPVNEASPSFSRPLSRVGGLMGSPVTPQGRASGAGHLFGPPFGASANGTAQGPAPPSTPGGLLRPGPLVLGPAAPSHLMQWPPAMLGAESRSSSGSGCPPYLVVDPTDGQDGSGSVLGSTSPSSDVEQPEGPMGHAQQEGDARAGAAGEPPEASRQLEQRESVRQRWLSRFAGEGDDSGVMGEGAGEQGREGVERRPSMRRQMSTGKNRFAAKLVTQNSSVDALVAEAMVAAFEREAAEAAEAEAAEGGEGAAGITDEVAVETVAEVEEVEEARAEPAEPVGADAHASNAVAAAAADDVEGGGDAGSAGVEGNLVQGAAAGGELTRAEERESVTEVQPGGAPGPAPGSEGSISSSWPSTAGPTPRPPRLLQPPELPADAVGSLGASQAQYPTVAAWSQPTTPVAGTPSPPSPLPLRQPSGSGSPLSPSVRKSRVPLRKGQLQDPLKAAEEAAAAMYGRPLPSRRRSIVFASAAPGGSGPGTPLLSITRVLPPGVQQ